MSWEDEFKQAEQAEVSNSKYMNTPRATIVEVMSCKLSEDINKDHKGCPYMEVEFRDTNTEELNTSKFFRTRAEDSEETKGFKLKGIKEFFMNAGIDMKTAGAKALVEVVGKQLKALFRSEEYIGYDKDQNNMPVVKTTIRYLYSGPIDQEFSGSSKYFNKILKADEKAKFDAELKTWERDNKASSEKAAADTKANTPSTEPRGDEGGNDDLPF